MLDKILNSFGTILKFFGVMIGLIVIGSIIAAIFGINAAVKSNSKSTSPNTPIVKQLPADIENNQNNSSPKDYIYDDVSIKVNSIKGGYFNKAANGYDEAILEIEIENKSSKKIRALSGVVTIKDVFGDIVQQATYKTDQDIPPGKTIREISLPLSYFSNKDQSLVGLSKFSSAFKPDKILVD
ncbi:hypothetical protein ACYB9R_00680 [Alcaligenes aquatilis]